MAEGLEQVLVIGSVKWGRRLSDGVALSFLIKEKHIIEQKALKKLFIKALNCKNVFSECLQNKEFLPIQQLQAHWMYDNSIFCEQTDLFYDLDGLE